MSFTLRWANNNAQATVVRIYRDTKDISPAALPAVLATLSNGETSYRDTTAVPGQTYYYLLTVTANDKTVAGASQKYTIAVKRGIGPSTILWGDDKLGWLGNVPYEERFLGSQLPPALLAMFPGSAVFSDRVELNKMTRNGKILYTLATLSPGWIDWATLYNSGLVYGTGDAGPANGHPTLSDVIQNASVVHNGDTYRIRLMRGLTDAPTSPVYPFDASMNEKTHDSIPGLGFCEYNDLAYTQVVNVPVKQRGLNWQALATSYLAGLSTSGFNYYNGGVVCQEHDSATTNVLMRGSFNAGVVSDANYMQLIRYRPQSQVGRYIPVFELME